MDVPAGFNLKSESPYKVLLSLAWPIILARVTQSVIGFTDALFVAPLGEASLAAATTGSFNTIAVLILPLGIVFIVQSFASQLRGAGNLEGVRRYAYYGLIFSGLAALGSLLLIPLVPWLLSGFDYAPDVQLLMSEYLVIRLLSVGPAIATEALGNWYSGLNNTRMALIAGAVAMVANVVGNYLLVEPRFGLPGYGVAGAAWASVAATCLGFITILFAFLRNLGVDLARTKVGFAGAEFRRMLRFGLPNGINWFFEIAAFALFINVAVAHLGTTALAAFNVVIQINSLSFMPAFGLGSAGAVLVGEAIGKKSYDAVWPIVRRTVSLAMLWMVSVGLIYILSPAALIRLFIDNEASSQNLLSIGTTMLVASGMWQLFDALGITLSEALRAAGDTTWCMAARIILAWVVFLPGAWYLVVVRGGGAQTVMFCFAAYLALLAVALGFRFATGKWKSINLLGSAP